MNTFVLVPLIIVNAIGCLYAWREIGIPTAKSLAGGTITTWGEIAFGVFVGFILCWTWPAVLLCKGTIKLVGIITKEQKMTARKFADIIGGNKVKKEVVYR